MISQGEKENPNTGELKKCLKCKIYTFKNTCKECKQKTKSAHYMFPKIRNAPPRSAPFKRR